MQKIYLLLVTLFLVGQISVQGAKAQDSLAIVPYTKTQSSWFSFLEYKCATGAYEEVIKSAPKYFRKSQGDPVYISARIQVSEALAYYALLNIEKSTNLINELENTINACPLKEDASIAWLSVAYYYEQIGAFSKASSIISKSDSIGVLSKTSYTNLDLLWHKSIIAFHMGYYRDALKLIAQQEPTWQKMASDNSSTYQARWYKEDDLEASYRKSRYAALRSLEAQCLVNAGKYTEADSLIKELKLWNSKNEYELKFVQDIKILSISGELNAIDKRYGKAADYYLSAYSNANTQNNEVGKICAMTEAIEMFFRSSRPIESQSYLRRLQALAFQSVGKKENNQIAYEYCESFRLYNEGNDKDSEKRLLKLLTTYEELPDNHPLKFKAYLLLSELYEKSGKISKLLSNEETLAGIRLKYYGKNSVVYHLSRIQQALFEIKYGKNFGFVSAIMKVSYDGMVSKQLDEGSAVNIRYLYSYASLYKKMDKLDSAAYRLNRVVGICEKNYGVESAAYLLALANYSDILIIKGAYKEGLENLQKTALLADKVKNMEVESSQRVFLILGKLHKMIGEYDKSRKYLRKALAQDATVRYVDFLLLAEASEQSASLNLQTNNFYKADKLLSKSLSLKKKNLPEGNPLFYDVYNTYAELKIATGDITGVEQYLNLSTAIAKEVYGPTALTGVDASILMGEYYYLINDLKKSEAVFVASDKIVVDKLGSKHLKHAELLLKLVSVRAKLPNYKKTDIEKLYTEALDIVKNALGVNNPLYMEINQAYARFYISTNKLADAEKILLECEKYWKSTLGDNNQHTASIFDLRGDIYYLQNKYKDAENYYTKSKDIYGSIFNSSNRLYTNVYSKIARVHFMTKNSDKAISIMDEIIPNYLEFTVKYFPALSSRQKKEYWAGIKDEFEFYNTLAFSSTKSNPELWGKAYNNVLATKAILLNSGLKLLNQVMTSEDTILIDLYTNWVAKKESLVGVLSMSKEQLTEQGIDKGKLEAEIESLEKEMSARSNLFANEDKKKKLITWEDVKGALIQNEYAVEIIRYRSFYKNFTDTIYYASLVVKHSSSKPELILSSNGVNMEKRNLKYYRNTTVTHSDDEYSYDVYWKNIKSIIPDGAVVYLSGDGVYNQLNVEMLRHSDGVYALDENQFVFVSNTKDLLFMNEQASKKSKEQKKENTTEFLLCGSPQFYSGVVKIETKNVPDLPGTEVEISMLKNLLATNNRKTTTIIKDELTEDTLKTIKNPKVIHIATHGFFEESSSSNDDELSNSPLLNSGLMLTNSGDIVDNHENSYVNHKSGILTAYEAMNLILDNTDLVVLSACETGRGEVQVGEGVSGLQRSFLLAGSKAVIVSLFKVNDEITQKLMLSFYTKWLKTGDKRKAFWDAKKEIKEQYKDPVFWGAFIMIEGKPGRPQGFKAN